MPPDAPADDTVALLEALVDALQGTRAPADLLHPRVTLHRLDGVVVAGRPAVVDAVTTRGTGARFRVLARDVDVLHVALEIEGVPGHLALRFTGRVSEGTLIEVRMG